VRRSSDGTGERSGGGASAGVWGQRVAAPVQLPPRAACFESPFHVPTRNLALVGEVLGVNVGVGDKESHLGMHAAPHAKSETTACIDLHDEQPSTWRSGPFADEVDGGGLTHSSGKCI
jgi:hypothetical protein